MYHAHIREYSITNTLIHTGTGGNHRIYIANQDRGDDNNRDPSSLTFMYVVCSHSLKEKKKKKKIKTLEHYDRNEIENVTLTYVE